MSTFEKTVPATDLYVFKYFGTWQATDENCPSAMVSYWTAAYVEFDFTGDGVTLIFSRESSFKYRIDTGEYKDARSIDGKYTVSCGDRDRHTVRVLSQNRRNHIYFAGVVTNDGCIVLRTADKPHYIQFVGDSISETPLSFSHRAADILGWDYSVIACSAVSLMRNRGYWRQVSGWYWDGAKNCWHEGSMAHRLHEKFGCLSIGMEDAFFKRGIPTFGPDAITGDPEFDDFADNYFTEKFDYDFGTGNYPDIVFIFLGTNDLTYDELETVKDAFVQTYKRFVARLFEIYGKDLKICIMQGLTGGKGMPISLDSARISAIQRAARELIKNYPDNIFFIDHETVDSWHAEISEDKTHPSPAGYDTLTREVAKYLETHF